MIGLRRMLGLKALPSRSPEPPSSSGETLIEQYRLLHQMKPGYGASSEVLLGHIQVEIEDLRVSSILDYGCGQSRLIDWLAKLNNATGYRYDPAIVEYAVLPTDRVDLVVNTDVLEHIPEQDIGTILGRIASISALVYFNISTIPAVNILPNGDNAHCTVRPMEWWRERLTEHFPSVRSVRACRHTTCSFVTW